MGPQSGVSVAVLRPGKQRFDSAAQLGMLALHREIIARRLGEADAPVLLRVSHSGVVLRTLDDLIKEIEGR
jgi:hypothetical protein